MPPRPFWQMRSRANALAVRSGECRRGDLDDDGRHFVRIRVGCRTTIFQATFPTIFNSTDLDTDVRTTVRNTVAVQVDGMVLMLTGQTLLVVRTVDSD